MCAPSQVTAHDRCIDRLTRLRIVLRRAALIDRLDDTLKYAIEHEAGLSLSEVTNYNEVRGAIEAALSSLRDEPDRNEEPVIYHLDVGAMYPNIILTNRLQPPAIVTEQTCASCVYNKPESNCKRSLQWMWRGEVFPAGRAEVEVIRTQIEHEPVPGADGQPPRSFFELETSEQNARFRARLKEYCSKVYKKTHITKMELRTATTCQVHMIPRSHALDTSLEAFTH